MPDLKRIGSVALAVALLIQLTPPRVNAQAALVVVPVGAAIVILGGIAYYTWINTQGQEQLVPTTSAILEDPEEEMERMGSNATQGRIVVADNASEAQTKCEQYADYRRTDTPENLGNGRWKCRYS